MVKQNVYSHLQFFLFVSSFYCNASSEITINSGGICVGEPQIYAIR